MPSQKTVTRNVQRFIENKERVGGKNPFGTIGDKVDGTRQQVAAAVEALHEGGHVKVKKQANGKVSEVIAQQPRRHADRTERSPQNKRERTWAKGVPAYLSDSQCGPVTVTQIAPKPGPPSSMKTSVVESEEYVYDEAAPYHDRLNVCIKVLRDLADANGYGDRLSVTSVLTECIKGMTRTRVQRAMTYLSGMGVYTTSMVAFRTSSYQLDLEITEVTAEMVRQFNDAARSKAIKPADEVSTVELADDSVHQLADIIEAQERQISQLNELVVRLDEELAEERARNQELTASSRQLRKKLDALQDKLDQPVQQDPRIAAIIKRHGGRSS